MPIPRQTPNPAGAQNSTADTDQSQSSVSRARTTRTAQAEVGGWEPLVVEEVRHTVINLIGDDQTGKTHFAFSAPDPILWITGDPGNARGVAKKFQHKNIQKCVFDLPKGLVQTQQLRDIAEKEQNRVRATFLKAVESGYFRTIITDREDELWELWRYSEFDEGKAKGHHYTPVNVDFKAMLKGADKNKVNLITISAMTAEYVDNKPTGKMKKAGFKHLGMLTQIAIQAFRDDYDNFSMQIRSCRDDATKNGIMVNKQVLGEALEITNEAGDRWEAEMSFENVMTWLIEGSKREEWV